VHRRDLGIAPHPAPPARVRGTETGIRRFKDDAPLPVATFHLAVEPIARSPAMNSLRLFVLTAACAVLATPIGSAAAPAESSAACPAPRLTLVERRVSEEAARGLPTLVSFVNRTQGIYQLRLANAVDMLDAERERKSQCMSASAAAVSD
jgi:hypothetical protein